MTAPDSPNETEFEILEEIAGLRPAQPWGACVGACLGWLAGAGYITRKFGGRPTPKGVEALKAKHPEWTPDDVKACLKVRLNFNVAQERNMHKDLTSYIEKLGLVATDRVTNFTGVIDSIVFDLYGCIQASVKPRTLDEKKQPQDGRWFDISRLTISDERVMEVPRHFLAPVPPSTPADKGCADRATSRG